MVSAGVLDFSVSTMLKGRVLKLSNGEVGRSSDVTRAGTLEIQVSRQTTKNKIAFFIFALLFIRLSIKLNFALECVYVQA